MPSRTIVNLLFCEDVRDMTQKIVTGIKLGIEGVFTVLFGTGVISILDLSREED